MKALVLFALGLVMCGALTGCRKLCEDEPDAISTINRDGTEIYSVSGNCTALDNFVTFYFQSPRSGRIVLAEADNVEYAGMYFQKSSRTIFVFVPYPKKISLRPVIENYRVRALRLQARTPEEMALFDRWSNDPNDPKAVGWVEDQIHRAAD